MMKHRLFASCSVLIFSLSAYATELDGNRLVAKYSVSKCHLSQQGQEMICGKGPVMLLDKDLHFANCEPTDEGFRCFSLIRIQAERDQIAFEARLKISSSEGMNPFIDEVWMGPVGRWSELVRPIPGTRQYVGTVKSGTTGSEADFYQFLMEVL